MPRSWQNTRTRCPLASCSVISLLQSFRLVSRTFQMCPLPNYLKRAVHEALTNSGFRQRHCQMSLAHAGRPQQNDIRCFVDESKRAQLANLTLVDGGLKSKVELIECLHVRQMRQLQPGLEIALPPCVGFRAHHFEQEVGVGRFLLRGAFE